MFNRISLPIFLVLLNSSLCINAMQMAIDYGTKKCFTTTVRRATKVYAEFNVASGPTPMHLDLYVTNERGGLIQRENGISHSKFTIPAQHHSRPLAVPNSGGFEVIRFCLIHQLQPHERQVTGSRRVFFDIYVDEEISTDGLVLKKNVDETTQKIQALEKSLTRVINSIDDIKALDAMLYNINGATARHLVVVSSLTCVVIIAVGLVQFDFIKSSLKSVRAIY